MIRRLDTQVDAQELIRTGGLQYLMFRRRKEVKKMSINIRNLSQVLPPFPLRHV